MRRSLVVLAVAIFLLAGLAVYSWREGRQEDSPRNGGSRPAVPADRQEALRQRIRDRLGVDPEALAALAEHLPDDPALRVAWLRANRASFDLAIRSGDPVAGPRALRVLREAIPESGGDVRTLLAGPGYREVWLRALSSKSPVLRSAAAVFLARLGGDRSRSLVVPLLSDPSPEVRTAAVRAYADLCDRPGSARLARLFAREKEARVRLAVLDAFGRHGDLRSPEARHVEREAIRRGTTAERIQGMNNLCRYRDQDALETVESNLGHADPAVRRSALDTLAFLKDRRALPALRVYVEKESDPRLREQALALIRTLSG